MNKTFRTQAGFTLIELMVTIAIIGLLAGLFLGGLQRAQLQANVVNTKTTIAKLNTTIMQHWESYQNRPAPIDPQLVLQAIVNANNTGGSAYPVVTAFMQNLGLINGPGQVNATNYRQLAAVRLLAIRELQMYEMPSSFDDFAVFTNPSTGNLNPPPYSIRTPVVLPSPPPLAYAYLAKLNAASTSDPNQIAANGAAECLYLVMSTGAQDDVLLGDHINPNTVGDVDADGLLEIQDAWREPSIQYTTSTVTVNGQTTQVANTRKTNKPITWIRWPAGYLSDLQPDPTLPPNATQYPPQQLPYEFSIWRHDIFDPLKLDVPPMNGIGGNAPPPRGYSLFPLIYSAGPDGQYELSQNPGGSLVAGTQALLPDPYLLIPDPSTPGPPVNPTNGLSGAWQDSNKDGRNDSLDNITNQNLGTGTGIGS